MQRVLVIARRHLLAHALQPGVSEIRRVGFDGGVLVGIVENDSDVAIPAKLEKALVPEALVARLDCMSQSDPVDLDRQEIDEPGNVIPVELPPRGQLPHDRPELWAKRGESLGKEIADTLGSLAKPRARDAEARALDREL